MSYILDALKKADQQRQHAAPATLRSAPESVIEVKKSRTWVYGALAILLLGAGVLIGWLQPWQPTASPQKEIVSATSAAPQTPPAPPLALPTTNRVPAPELPAPTPAPARPPAPEHAPEVAHPPPPAPAAQAAATTEPPRERTLLLEELPLAVRQELPQMTVSLHAWSPIPKSRLVSINNQLLHEGDSPAAGVRLDEITPDGMIMSYRGYRFRRGVQ